MFCGNEIVSSGREVSHDWSLLKPNKQANKQIKQNKIKNVWKGKEEKKPTISVLGLEVLLFQKLSCGYDLSTVQLKHIFKTVWVVVMGMHN